MIKKLLFSILIVFLFLNTSIYSVVSTKIEQNNNIKITTNSNSDYDNRYALIMVGRSHAEDDKFLYKCFTKQLKMMYDTLTDYYGFEDQDIQILFREQDQYEPEDPDFIDYVLSRGNTYDSTEDSLIERLNNVKNKIGDGDLFLFNYIGHGGSKYTEDDDENKHSYLWVFEGETSDSRIFDDELSSYTQAFDGFKIFLISACYSGSFINTLSGENRIVMTLTTVSETGSSAWMTSVCEALQGYGDIFESNFDNGDGNKNGFVDMDEVFRYPNNKQSLIDDNGDGEGYNWDDKLHYDPSKSGEDGHISKTTTLGNMNVIVHGSGPTEEVYPGETVQFETLWVVGGGGARTYEYNWDFNSDGKTDSTEKNPTCSFNEAGKYEVTLTVESCGETGTYETTVFVSKDKNIKADGIIYYEELNGGEHVTGSFSFENNGEEGSSIDWEIKLKREDFNDFDISFSQMSGTDLKPSDGKITIDYDLTVVNNFDGYCNNFVQIFDVYNEDRYDEVKILLVSGKSELKIERDNLYIPGEQHEFGVGEEIKGFFEIENNAGGTCLEWGIDENNLPDWGEWSFSEESGYTEVRCTVEVNIVISNKGNYDGEIKVVNKNDPDNYDTVSVSLSIKKIKIFDGKILYKFLLNHPILYKFFQFFENLINI